MDRIQRGPLESCLGPRQNPVPPPRNQFALQPAQRPVPQFTPLTKPRSEILELHANLFKRPRPMRETRKPRSREKYCRFHEDFGHETEECKNLMYDIEGLVRSGPLKNYQDRGAGMNQFDTPSSLRSQKKKRQHRGGSCNTEVEKKVRYEDDADGDGDYQFDGVIATVSGLTKGQTKSSLKNRARTLLASEPVSKRLEKEEMITFSEKDPVPTVVPHSDAIIIEAVVANKLVKRIHIDTGASVSIIVKGCFDQMRIDKSKVTPTARPLQSFAQEETHQEGIVELPITVGKVPTSSTEVTDNIILG